MLYIKERYQNYKLPINEKYSTLEIKGVDTEQFLHGQLTSDIKSLKENEFQATARLNRLGQVISFGYIAKRTNEKYLFIIENELIDIFIDDLNKYIIMEDVEIIKTTESFEINWIVEKMPDAICGIFSGEYAEILIGKSRGFNLLNNDVYEKIRRLNGAPVYVEIKESKFINDTYLEEIAISYDKGCFLGQETTAKIHNNRGAAYYPNLLKLNSKINEMSLSTIFKDIEIRNNGEKFGVIKEVITIEDQQYIIANVKRDFRVQHKNYDLEIGSVKIRAELLYLPLFRDKTIKEKAKELYYCGVEKFKDDDESEAIDLLKSSIKLDPAFADSYESLGVILGRHGRYEEAIGLMDQLLKVDDASIMAHTNKSLYLMKLGKIEEAEEEKGLATVKSFQNFGKEAENKRVSEELAKKESEELIRKESMFKQVLEIDEEDTIANFGMGEINFKRGLFKESVAFFETVIKIDSKYSRAYLLLGKSLESLGETSKAKEIYEKGILVASKKGELMPANEMQERVLKL